VNWMRVSNNGIRETQHMYVSVSVCAVKTSTFSGFGLDEDPRMGENSRRGK